MEFRARRRDRSGLDLTPLVDVIFQLLVFFLLTANFLRPSLRLELPEGAVRDDAAGELVRLEISAAGEMRLDGRPVAGSALRTALERAVSEGHDTVRVSGDRGMSYAVFVEALDAARLAGFANFDLVHETSAGAEGER